LLVADSGIFRTAHQVWQRTNITATAAYLREILKNEPDNARVRALYEGLLDVLEPTRRMVRQQKELAASKASPRHPRSGMERRAGRDRRTQNLPPPNGVDRRRAADRRTGRDRRKT
jgi:hypothetical protein